MTEPPATYKEPPMTQITITFDPENTKEVKQLLNGLSAILGTTPTAPATKPGTAKVETKPNTAKVETKPEPTEEQVNTEAANDATTEPEQQSIDLEKDPEQEQQLRDLAKKLIVKNRAAVLTILSQFKVKQLSEIPADKIQAAIAAVKKALA
jgi:hypothetical protein